MTRASWTVVAAMVSAILPSAVHAQGKTVRVAVYAPWSGPSTADDRHAFALEIEEAVTASGHGTAKVSTFAKRKDFRRSIAAGTVDIAVVDAGATDALGKRLKVVGAWSSGSGWVLAGSTSFDSLRNKRLALQAHDARSSARMVEVLLRGVVSASYWSSIVSAPVTEDARQLVLRDKADVVLVPKRLAAEMTVLADIGTFSELAIATTNRKKLAKVTDVVRDAVQARFGGRWSDGKPTFPKPVGQTRLVAAVTADSTLDIFDLIARPATALPALPIDALWIEPDAP